MKRLLFLPLLVLCLSGCMMEELDKESPVQEAKEYLVPIKMAGEILEIEEGPLTKAGENNDLYGFQINSKKAGETSYSPYAYGLFDDISDVKVKLISGAEYEFVCTMVMDWKSKIWGINHAGQGTPFKMNLNNYNEFIYDTKDSYENDFKRGLTEVGMELYYVIPNTDRYYGTIDKIDPLSASSLSINMKRVVFGLKCIADGLTEGELKIRVMKYTSDDSPYLSIKTRGDQSVEEIYTFDSFYLDDNGDLSRAYTLEVTHIHVDNTQEIIVNEYMTFKRNKKTIVTIKIKKSNGDTGTKGVDVVLDDTPMTDGDKVVIDGK